MNILLQALFFKFNDDRNNAVRTLVAPNISTVHTSTSNIFIFDRGLKWRA